MHELKLLGKSQCAVASYLLAIFDLYLYNYRVCTIGLSGNNQEIDNNLISLILNIRIEENLLILKVTANTVFI